LLADEQIVESPVPTTTTFALPIDTNMAPGFTLLVFHVTLHAELVADSVFVPVTGFNGYEVSSLPFCVIIQLSSPSQGLGVLKLGLRFRGRDQSY
jgi:hypothetical protein